jgi:outer membrane protein OmpA-like peptidoglycan-associated protein
MKVMLHLFVCGALAVAAQNLRAQDQDAEGCKDSAMITRMPGSTIHSCENKEYEQAKLPLGTDKDGNAKEKAVEGEYHYWDYGTREGMSEIQVFRNFEAVLKKAGFTIDFEESPGTITAHKGATWYLLDNKGTFYYQTIVTEKQMQQEVTADGLADEINKSGHVAVYGIHFDTAKATIQPDSENILGQIAALLQQNADLKLRVEGHTDSQGNAAVNQALSEKRAQAVVAWLTGKGVAASRLTAKGFGATKPVADNGTDEGRAKNRRVELAKT